MGYNTSMIVLNDALHQIDNDPDFGKNVSDAVRELSSGRKDIGIRSGNHINAATVIETHHADETTLIAFGGNCASILGGLFGHKHNEPEFQVELLKEAASKLGYKLIRKPKK